MELTREQKRRVCALAAQVIEREKHRFRPASLGDSTDGRVVMQVWRGMVGDRAMCEVKLKWWYSTAAGINANAVEQEVHVCQRLYRDQTGRWRVHLEGWHLPLWEGWSGCARCGKGFDEQEIIVADTSLHEF